MSDLNFLSSFEQKLLNKLQAVDATNHLVVALSGGLDSKTLLHALVRLRELKYVSKIQAIHVNHGLQKLSKQWQIICQADCEHYQVEMLSTNLYLSNTCHSNIEAKARDGRYQFFESTLKDNQSLLMAHHLDDQAETLLFRLLRGCGLSGAAAMPEQRRIGKGRLLRPLLDFTQEEILNYAEANRLSWIEDPSNRDEKYSRNFIRHQITPKLKVKWPAYAKVLARFSKLVTEQCELLDEIADTDLLSVLNKSGHIDVDSLLTLSIVRQKNCLHYWGKLNGLFAPSSNEIDQIIKQLEASLTQSIEVNFAGLVVRSYLAQLNLVTKYQPKPISKKIQWQDLTQALLLENGIELAVTEIYQGGLRLPTSLEKVWVDRRRGGEKCATEQCRNTSELKKIYQQMEVPSWEREWLPIIYFNNEIAAVPGCFVANKFKTEPGAKGVNITLSFNSKIK
jgi:tRNA(Ile)-lysidine synthase